jgi:RNA polymerase sigma-70 factor (ECF subfamily)
VIFADWVGMFGKSMPVGVRLIPGAANRSTAARAPEILQESTNDIQPDGLIRSKGAIEFPNQTNQPLRTIHFINSDFVHVEKIYDAKGRPVAFQAKPGSGSHIEYDVTLNEPAPPGSTVSGTIEEIQTGLIKATGEPGVFQYSMNHWPEYDGVTHRIELHRLPPGAELIDKSPDDLKEEKVGDHIELRVDRRIPPGGNIEVRYRYRLANAGAADQATPSILAMKRDVNKLVSEFPAGPDLSRPEPSVAVEERAAAPGEEVLAGYEWPKASEDYRVARETPVTIDGRSALKIQNTTDGPLQLSLLKIEKPPVTSMNYALSGEIKYEDVHGAGYLEMWSYFPPIRPGVPEGQYFSRTLGAAGSGPMGQIAGTSSWRTYTLPFDRTGTSAPPSRLQFNIFLPGRGAVYICAPKLTQAVEAEISRAENADQTLAGQRPVVVETVPVSGARDVAPGETEIRVRFSKEMTDKSWSWSTAWKDSSPEISDVRYEDDRKTCVAKAILKPGRTYAFWLNSENFQNFKDSDGYPAVPYLLTFRTKQEKQTQP